MATAPGLEAVPELPEVEIVRRGLATACGRPHHRRREVLHPRAVRRHLAGAGDFAAAVGRPRDHWRAPPRASTCGCRWTGMRCWPILGMSGQLLVGHPDTAGFRCTSGPGSRSRRSVADLRFTDQRTFGHLVWSPRWRGAACADRAYRAGPAGSGLRRRPCSSAGCARRRTDIKRALLDQSLVSGIGNIYADESLWRARLHWARPAEAHERGRPDRPAAGRGPRGAAGRARPSGGTSFDSPVRERQRGERLLQPVTLRIRTGGRSPACGVALRSGGTRS